MFRRLLRLTKLFLWKVDLFSSSQLLRYKSQNSYSTLTGGFLSLVIIITFGTILISDAIDVTTKKNITAQDSTYYVENPTLTSFSFDDNSKFMLGIGILGMNLSDPYRYFDITMTKGVFSYGHYVNTYNEPLQQCQYHQWAHINQIGANSFNHANMTAFLCPRSNLTVELQGKFSSQSFRFLSISIGECHNQTDPSRPCVDPSTVDRNRSYGVDIYFMNPFVNSGDQEPVQYYFQDRNYLLFNPGSTIVSNLYLTEQTILTDNNLLPWSEVQNQTVLLVKQAAEIRYDKYQNPDQYNKYISFYLRKSPYYILSQRSFQKIDQLFSTIGGLFGFAVALFVFINFYTEASFQIQMGDVLFHYKEDEPLKAGSYNFFFHVVLHIFDILKKINIEIPWKRMKIYSQCREQVAEQLDISLLMNKVTFLEKCMNVIFEQHQFRAIYLQQKPSVKQAQILRRNHGLNKIIHKNSKKMDNKIKGRIKQRQSLLYRQSLSLPGSNNIQGNENYMRRQTCPDAIMEDLSPSMKQSSQSKEKHNVIDVVFNYIMNDQKSKRESSSQNNKVYERQSKSSDLGQEMQLENAAGQHHESLRFVHTALNDMRQIETQAKEGNKMSQRIYNQINNDITKDQIIILKCIESIVAQKVQINVGHDSDTNSKKLVRKQSQQSFMNSRKMPTHLQAHHINNIMITEQKIAKEQEQMGSDNNRIIQSSQF